jgi:hypothetical protein
MKGTTKQRGYDTKHKKLRKKYARMVATGTTPCARCGRLILPGEPWDLGNADSDRSIYAGPEHRACNRATAARRSLKPRWRFSRDW